MERESDRSRGGMEEAIQTNLQAQQDTDDVDDALDYESHRPSMNLVKDAAAHPSEQEVENLLLQGNYYFRLGLYEKAISTYNDAFKRRPIDPSLLLSNRCAAYCKFSQRLRKIPAASSEEHALYGLDPMSLVQLALKDVEKLLKLRSDWPKVYLRKGTALALLEQYDDAKDAFLTGLQLDPTSTSLQVSLQELTVEDEFTESEKLPLGSRKRARLQRSDDFDCTLCLKLLYNPVTTPCGHSFCRACLMQAMDHGNKCPMCRTVLFVSPKTYPLSVTLNNVIQRSFPEEYAERKAESDAITLAENEILPLFVMDFVLPHEKMGLNIFEPRYRLMVRRIMEGNHRMGMVGMDPQTGTIADVACEVEICECEPLPDGRFFLQVEGRRRCRITKTWEQDGYALFHSWCPCPPRLKCIPNIELFKSACTFGSCIVARFGT
ncbi:hypothetical protein O6H91_04G023100 [Diphasiastrum complanatum]|uniref:Uncharacterized protein n=1 Tax=Diphasiastrum complanatum TaxID=34168 RepID=A0ACC2DV06_DIPCM|nr:hypothetical protein O6H91_04G023100 [Diphasiastrum complanatum]